jgi:hypothetical protein
VLNGKESIGSDGGLGKYLVEGLRHQAEPESEELD